MNLGFDTITNGRCRIESDGSIVSITRDKVYGPFIDWPDTMSVPLHDLSIQATYQAPRIVFQQGIAMIVGGLVFGFLLFPLVFIPIGVLYLAKARKQGFTHLTIRSTKRRFRILAIGDHTNLLKVISGGVSPVAAAR